MTNNHVRWLAYPVAATVAGALIWAGFVRDVDADYLTLLSSGKVHAEMAAAIPADTDNADARELRERLLSEAAAWLDRADRVEPGAQDVAQLRAWVAVLRGDFEQAAGLYEALRQRPDCSAELQDLLALHIAKVWSIAGDHPRALVELEARPARGEPTIERRALHARLAFRAGRAAQAREDALALASGGSEESRLAGAELLEGMGEWSAAEAAYRRTDGDLQDYRLARLKLLSGQTDTAVELLEGALARGGREVRSALEADRTLWAQRAGERFESLELTDSPAAPAAGN